MAGGGAQFCRAVRHGTRSQRPVRGGSRMVEGAPRQGGRRPEDTACRPRNRARRQGLADGNEFTIGDLMMISVLRGLRGTAELAEFPRLAAYIARGESRPAHGKAMADHLATFDAPAPA